METYIRYISIVPEANRLKRKNRVKLARIENDLTQAQLAERVGATRQTIGLIEAGRYNPSLKLCLAIANALNKTLDELFWIVEDNHDTR